MKKRQRYSTHQKESLVQQFRDGDLSKHAFCKEQGLNQTTFNKWLAEDFKQRSEDEQKMLKRISELEAEVKKLQVQRDFLKKTTAFFATEKP